MTILWIVAGVVLVAWMWHRGTRPAVHSLSSADDVSHGIHVLLTRGADGSQFVVRLKRNPAQNVRVLKTVRGYGDFDCRLEVDLAANTDGAASLKDDLVDRQVPFEERASDAKLVIAFGTDRGLASIATWVAIQDYLSATAADSEFLWERVLVSNTPRLTGVDAPEQPWWR